MGGSWKRRPGRQLGGQRKSKLDPHVGEFGRTCWNPSLELHREGLTWSVCVLMLRTEEREGPGRKLLY